VTAWGQNARHDQRVGRNSGAYSASSPLAQTAQYASLLRPTVLSAYYAPADRTLRHCTGNHDERIWRTDDRRPGTDVRKLFALLQAYENWRAGKAEREMVQPLQARQGLPDL
jgi:hypothetical protein